MASKTILDLTQSGKAFTLWVAHDPYASFSRSVRPFANKHIGAALLTRFPRVAASCKSLTWEGMDHSRTDADYEGREHCGRLIEGDGSVAVTGYVYEVA